MTLKNYLLVMAFLTFVCWAIFIFVIKLVDPLSTNWLGFVLFYASLFLSVSGTTALLGFLIRFKLLRHELAFRSVRLAFKQSFIFALFVVLLFLLLAQDLFTWINLLLLVVIFAIWEYFSSLNKNKI